MKKLIQITLLSLLSTWLFAQDKIELKQDTKAGIYAITPAGPYIPPLDTCFNPCKDGVGITSTVNDPVTGAVTFVYSDGTRFTTIPLKGKDGDPGKPGTTPNIQVGTTTTGQPGTPALVTRRGTLDNPIFDFVIPRGADGTGSGGTTAERGVFDVTAAPYNAKGDGTTDDTQAFQNCFNAAVQANGKVKVPTPTNFYKLTNTINVRPAPGRGQARIVVDMWGWGGLGTNAIRYMGPSDRPVFYIVGIKTSYWLGMTVGIADGISGVTIFDVDTESATISSSTGTKFDTYYLDLGTGTNNVAFRTGNNRAPDGNDISNILYTNGAVYGNRKVGQIAYLNEGSNTLHLQWVETFTAFCDKHYSNAGPSGVRGNGSVYFFGSGGSQNNIDFSINHEQTYAIYGGRWEGGKTFMDVPNFAQVTPNITVEAVTIGDYSDNDGLFKCAVPANITLIGVYMNQTDGGAYSNPVTVSSGASGVGSLVMINCSISTNNTNPWNKTGGSWQVTTFGNTRMGTGSVSVTNKTHFPAEFAQMK